MFSDRPGALEKTDRVTANQHIFKPGFINRMFKIL